MPEERTTTTTDTGALAVDLLARYADARDGTANATRHDAGPLVLTSVAGSLGLVGDDLAHRVLRRWLEECPERFSAVGTFGGLGGFLAGVRIGVTLDDGLVALEQGLREGIPAWVESVHWRTSEPAWRDYDLFTGPAGLVLAGAATATDTPLVLRAARHLARLCADPALEPLRAGTDIDPRSWFNVGTINTGMGHGVTGVAAALRHAVETLDDGASYEPALRNATAWLVEEVYLAGDGLITWPPVGRDGAGPSDVSDRRQAWCYGTPGVSWTLWDAGRVLGEPSLQLLGEEAMASFCREFDPERHLDVDDGPAELAVCHGAAGTLAVADAFARHAHLREAERLREDLDAYLRVRSDRVAELAASDMSMLNGAGGVVAVMLASQGGARAWLRQLALR